MKQVIDKIRSVAALVFGTRLIVEGSGRTFVRAPMWFVVLAGLSSIRLALITALLVAAFGMRARIVRA